MIEITVVDALLYVGVGVWAGAVSGALGILLL